MKNTKKIKLPSEIAEAAADYAAALDEIGGATLAETLLEDDELPASKRAFAKLKGDKRDEARWIMGWFRGVADAKDCEPIAVLRAGRAAEKENAA
jgi:hypothetical protein